MWIFPTEVVIIDRQEGKQYTNRPINMDNIVTFDDAVFSDNVSPTVAEPESNDGSGYHIIHEEAPGKNVVGNDGLAAIQFKLSNGDGFYWVYPNEADRDVGLKQITEDLKGKKK